MPDRQIIRKFAATATAALMSAAFWSGTALAAPETDKPLPPPEQELKPASG